MASDPNRTAFRHIDRLFQSGTMTGLDEGQLLDRFVADRDELALEALVEWHGPMVLGVCRRWLANPHDVDDAFQATFLILVRKARSLRDVHRLGPWLHGVAYRVALRARADAVRRRALEQTAARPESDADVHTPDRLALRAELRGVVDEEVARLPASLRAAIVVCDLEGQSQHDAARLLGWSEGSLRGRLARARRKLRDRLERRGVAPELLPAGAPLLFDPFPTSLTSSLIEATTRAATASVLAGRASPSATTVISASVAALAQGVIHAMTLSKVKMLGFAAILAAVGLFTVGGFVRAGLSKNETAPEPRHSLLAEPRASEQTSKAVVETARARTLEFHVVRRSDKQPIPGATVEVFSYDRGSRHEAKQTTDAQGRCAIELAEGTSRLTIAIAKDGFVPVSRSIDEKGHPQGPPRSFTEELEPGLPIGGFLRDEQGRPIVGAEVTAAISQGKDNVPDVDVPAPASLSAYAGFPHILVKTDDRGRWRCSILPANADRATRLWFFVKHPDYVSDTGGYSRRLSLETARAMTGALVMNSGVNVSGQVRDGTDKPVTGAKVVLAYSTSSGNCLRTTTDAEGRFRFPHADKRGRLGRWSVSIEAAGFAPTWRLVVPTGQIPPLDFRLVPGKPFRGRVVDSKGKPIGQAAVSARWQECYHLDWKTQTDSDGRFVWPDGPSDGEISFDSQHDGFLLARGRRISANAGEFLITMNPPIRVRGTVVDAETGQPIPSFRVVPGESFQSDRILWRGGTGSIATGGRVDVSPFHYDQPGNAFFVRVNADGYGPATSRAIALGEADVVLEFKLKKAFGPSGFVRLPDGSRAVGAVVYLTSPKLGPALRNNQPQLPLPPGRGSSTRTDDKGHFAFAPQDEPFGVLVLHPEGVGQKSAEELAQSGGIRLEPFGRIEGTLRIGSRPGTKQAIRMRLDRTAYAQDRYLFFDYTAETDDQGRFAIDQVMPGEAQVFRSSSQATGRFILSMASPVDLGPGQTVRVEIGGQGRPVTGRVTLSEVATTRIDLATASGSLRVEPTAMPLPEDFETWDAGKKREWYLSAEGKARRRSALSYGFPVDSDGRFRIDDVVPGTYKLLVDIRSTPGFQGFAAGGILVSGKAERRVVIEAIPGGRGDEPTDVGTLKMTLEVRNQRQVGIGQTAPALDFKTLDGKTLHLADFRGKFVLLDFWATWCGPCLEEEPHVRAVHDAFGSDDRFVLIGLSLDESVDAPKDYVAKHNLKWVQGYLGQGSRATADYGVLTIPRIMLIGPDGKAIATDLHGLGIKEMVSQALGSRR